MNVEQDKMDFVILAAGDGKRFLSADPSTRHAKQFELLAGRMVLLHSLDTISQWPFCGQIVIVLPQDGVEIDISSFKIPHTNNHLVIEGAGGLLVPLNDKDTILNLIESLNCEVILVSRHYLGSINHTLMSIETLHKRKIPIKGILFNGKENKDTESIITKMSSENIIGRIDELDNLNKSIINSVAQNLKNKLI